MLQDGLDMVNTIVAAVYLIFVHRFLRRLLPLPRIRGAGGGVAQGFTGSGRVNVLFADKENAHFSCMIWVKGFAFRV